MLQLPRCSEHLKQSQKDFHGCHSTHRMYRSDPSLGPWVLKVQFQMMSGFCQTPLPEIFKRQIRSSARWMRHNGHLPMFRLNRAHQNVSFNGCYWTLKGRFQRACAATRMRPLLFCCGEKPRHGKMLPENTLKKPCWLPVGWWFKLSTYLSNVSGFDWSS